MIDNTPRWLKALQGRDGFGARALRLLAVAATRSQEIRGALWHEIDLGKADSGRLRKAMMQIERLPLTEFLTFSLRLTVSFFS